MSGVLKTVGTVFAKVFSVGKTVATTVAKAAPSFLTAGLANRKFSATEAFMSAIGDFTSSGPGSGAFSQAATALGLVRDGNPVTSIFTDNLVHDPSKDPLLGMGRGKLEGMLGGAIKEAASGGGKGGLIGKFMDLPFEDKLFLASIGTKAVGSLLAPSLDEQYRKRAKFRGAFYGHTAKSANAAQAATPDGTGAVMPPRSPQAGRQLIPTSPALDSVSNISQAPSREVQPQTQPRRLMDEVMYV